MPSEYNILLMNSNVQGAKLTEENYQTEKDGYDLGNNPYFGKWEQRFDFPPVSYSNKSELKQKFKTKLQSKISTNYIYTQQIQLQIILYLNEEKMLNTPEYGDLDNYAKTICDAIKGSNGLIIDDCQIQRLDISWIDIPNESYFEIEIQSTPDDYCYNKLSLYEMNDKMYYPISEKTWDNGEMLDMDLESKFFGIASYSMLTHVKKKIHHKLRENGTSPIDAYYDAKRLSPTVLGYHKTRIIDSGFDIIKKSIWKDELKNWLSTSDDSDLKTSIIKILDMQNKQT